MASTRFCATGGYAVCHPRCGKHWCPNPSFASLTSSLPFAALRARSGPLPLMKPRAATGLDTNAPPPLVAGNEMGIIGPKRVNHCPAVARVCTALQVVWWNVAGPVAKRRRSAFLASPATLIGHRSKKASQVRPFSQTCDTLGGHLRRFGL